MLLRPPGAWALFVLAHGAGAGMRHPSLQALSEALAAEGVATLRYQFPYMDAGGGRIDPKPVLHARVREAVEAGHAQGLPLFAGGKSMGGRMTSEAAAQSMLRDLRGLAFVGFPLHPAGRPGVARAEHLRGVSLPMLFLQGTRDALADLSLLRPVVAALPQATLHVLDDADHSFQVRKKSGRTEREVLAELGRAFAAWARSTLEGRG